MNPVILFRSGTLEETAELDIANNHVPCVKYRTQCKDSLVIGRYSVLPFYEELEAELRYNGCSLLNSHAQHQWIANFDYYYDLHQFTPKTWKSLAETTYEGPFVVKGKTNSRKHQWNTHMFAENRRAAIEVASELTNDTLIGLQDLVYREYIPLKTFEVGLNGIRFANEWRLFFLGNNLLSYGYYWSTSDDPSQAYLSSKGLELAHEIAKVASDYVNFFVVDIAETEKEDWILIELNDGQMSGLSMNDPEVLYSRLAKFLPEFTKEMI